MFIQLQKRQLQYQFQFQMRVLHSIEIRNLLEADLMKGSRCEPDSASNLTTYSNNNSHTLKRSESSSTLRSSPSDIQLIEQRYQALESDYSELFQKNKKKADLLRKQKEELQRYTNAHERDKKEIERLKSLLAIAKKSQFYPSNFNQNPYSEKTNMRNEKHTSSVPKERRSPLSSKNSNPYRQSITPNTSIPLRKMGGRRQQGQNQFSRLKFTPSIILQ